MSKIVGAAILFACAIGAGCGGSPEPGPEPDGGVDECALGTDDCDPHARCDDLDVGFACTCAEGYAEASAGTCAPDCPYVYREGHGDLFVSFASGALAIHVRSALDEGTSEERLYGAEDVCLVVPRATYEDVAALGGRPAADAWTPLGVAAGTSFWYLSQAPTEGVPWFGVSTEGISSGALVGDIVELALHDVRGPSAGHVAAWFSSALGAPTFLFATADARLETTRPAGDHAHMSWAFTAEGIYALDFVARGTMAPNEEVESATVTLRVYVE